MRCNATKSGGDVLDKLVRKYTCTRSTSRLPLKLLLNLIDVACVYAFVLWMLKYPNWQQKKNNRSSLYLLSLGEEMLTPHTRIRADSGNADRHTRRAVRAMGVTCKPASTTNVKKDGGSHHGKCSIGPTAKDRKTDWKCCQCPEWVCKYHSMKTIKKTCNNCNEHSY
jgi:hypothetical protein